MLTKKLPNAAATRLTVTTTATSLSDLIATAGGEVFNLAGLDAIDLIPDGAIRILADGNTPTTTEGLLIISFRSLRGIDLTKLILISLTGNVEVDIQVGTTKQGEIDFADTAPPQSEGAGALSQVLNVAASAPVSGARDGSFDRPFATIQDAINSFGDPVDQTDYARQLIISVLDRVAYTENLTFTTRRYTLRLNGNLITGNITVNINNALRFGSPFNPGVDIYSDTRPGGAQIIGNILYTLTGTPVTNIAHRYTNVLHTGNITIADGVNGGAAVNTSTLGVCVLVGSGITGTFLGRNTLIECQNSNIAGSIEALDLSRVTDSILSGAAISLYGISTTRRIINNLTLSATGGVVWTNVNGIKNWESDAYTWGQIALRTTGSFTNAFVPLNRLPALTAADNTDLSTELAAFPNTLAVINNLRTRQAQLQARLQTTNIII